MINELATKIYENAVEKGFYEDIQRVLGRLTDYPADAQFVRNLWIAARLMLIVSELGEGMEGLRDGNFSAEPKSGGVGEELADGAIRILDLMRDLRSEIGVEPEAAILGKSKYNSTRPARHGRKTL